MHSARAAITLIEVAIVILIVGVMAAVATPRFADTQRISRLEAATWRVANDIQRARQTALRSGRSVQITFSNDDDSYQAEQGEQNDRSPTPALVSIKSIYDPSIEMVASMDGNLTLSFNFEGVPHSSGEAIEQATIALSSGSDLFQVHIVAGTGEVVVERSSGAISQINNAEAAETETSDAPTTPTGTATYVDGTSGATS
ncbi:MAG: GspH/FimT family pseudopilin [Rubripirellula sp.]